MIPSLVSLPRKDEITLFWFRRDLRLEDNHGFYRALKVSDAVLPIFIFDVRILGKLTEQTDGRVQFIYEQIRALKIILEEAGSTLLVCHGDPVTVYQRLIRHLNIKAVYTNHDYEPYAKTRDEEVAACLAAHGIAFCSFKDQVIFEKDDVLKENGTPYTVFTPYMRKWKALFNPSLADAFASDTRLHRCLKVRPLDLLLLRDMGFQSQHYDFPNKIIDLERIQQYRQRRDTPSVVGTSRLGIHFRFGTISIRAAIKIASIHNPTWLNELIWREFYMMILWHFPHVVTRSFKTAYDRVQWQANEAHFQAWCAGQTGYPLVDAGMRELNATGYMHNRLRMITASFLTKHLLIDWRWGETYFAGKLLDFELSSNNGGWQWAAGSGCDAAPYFRIFNPYLQTQKFDPKHAYIKEWVPELGKEKYPSPIVSHTVARNRALATYKQALVDSM